MQDFTTAYDRVGSYQVSKSLLKVERAMMILVAVLAWIVFIISL